MDIIGFLKEAKGISFNFQIVKWVVIGFISIAGEPDIIDGVYKIAEALSILIGSINK